MNAYQAAVADGTLPQADVKTAPVEIPKDTRNGDFSTNFAMKHARVFRSNPRAIGEAMAVMMVSGNVANMPSLFQSVRFLTTAVSSGMGYADGLYREALFSIALVLFLFIMMINAVLNFFLKGEKK